jgi:hypothetical protein
MYYYFSIKSCFKKGILLSFYILLYTKYEINFEIQNKKMSIIRVRLHFALKYF